MRKTEIPPIQTAVTFSSSTDTELSPKMKSSKKSKSNDTVDSSQVSSSEIVSPRTKKIKKKLALTSPTGDKVVLSSADLVYESKKKQRKREPVELQKSLSNINFVGVHPQKQLLPPLEDAQVIFINGND